MVSARHVPWVVAGLLLGLAWPEVRALLEARMSTHVLVQLPLLVACGYALGMSLRTRSGFVRTVENHWPSALLLGLATAALWMLPRLLDQAPIDPWIEAAKFISLPLVVGMPLALGWRFIPVVIRGMLWVQLISMCGWLGWLYQAAPARLCNRYLLADQQYLGLGLWTIGAVLIMVLGGRVLFALRYNSFDK